MPRALEAIAVALRQCTDMPALQAFFVAFFHEEAVRLFSYHHLPPPGADDWTATITVTAQGFPGDWVETYQARRYYDVDPIPKYALSSVYPFWWSDIGRLHPLTGEEKAYLAALRAADFGDGVAVPLFGPHGRNGYAGLGPGKGAPRWGDEKIARLQLAAQLGHFQYCHILHARAPRNIRLSAREAEVLEWVAKGKSNSVIADIIGISPNTVDTHIRRVFEKLGVADRVTAALRGLAVGVIG